MLAAKRKIEVTLKPQANATVGSSAAVSTPTSPTAKKVKLEPGLTVAADTKTASVENSAEDSKSLQTAVAAATAHLAAVASASAAPPAIQGRPNLSGTSSPNSSAAKVQQLLASAAPQNSAQNSARFAATAASADQDDDFDTDGFITNYCETEAAETAAKIKAEEETEAEEEKARNHGATAAAPSAPKVEASVSTPVATAASAVGSAPLQPSAVYCQALPHATPVTAGGMYAGGAAFAHPMMLYQRAMPHLIFAGASGAPADAFSPRSHASNAQLMPSVAYAAGGGAAALSPQSGRPKTGYSSSTPDSKKQTYQQGEQLHPGAIRQLLSSSVINRNVSEFSSLLFTFGVRIVRGLWYRLELSPAQLNPFNSDDKWYRYDPKVNHMPHQLAFLGYTELLEQYLIAVTAQGFREQYKHDRDMHETHHILTAAILGLQEGCVELILRMLPELATRWISIIAVDKRLTIPQLLDEMVADAGKMVAASATAAATQQLTREQLSALHNIHLKIQQIAAPEQAQRGPLYSVAQYLMPSAIALPASAPAVPTAPAPSTAAAPQAGASDTSQTLQALRGPSYSGK